MKLMTLLLVMGLSSSQCFAEEAEEVKPALEDSIKLSNYDWRYAPYVSHLKEQIEFSIVPSPGFRLGLVEGKIWARFKILRSGKIFDHQFLDAAGNPLKKDRWTRGVNVHHEARPLPEDFPEDYLEVTGIFDFSMIRLREEKEKPQAIDKDVVIISETVGEVIDLEERNRYGLFREVDGFLSAAYFKHSGDTYTIQLVTLGPSGKEVTQENPVSYAAVEMIRGKIEAAQE